MFNYLAAKVRAAIKFISDSRKGRVYYVVRVSDPEDPDERRAFDVAVADCHLFGGVQDWGIFKYKQAAEWFAQWRTHDAQYGGGYLYVVDRATDAEVDEYLSVFNTAQGQ